MGEKILQEVIKTFNVTQQVLDERKEVGVYIESLATLITDKFYEYLMLNKEFAEAIDKEEIPRLKRMRSDVIVALFCDPFDVSLIKKIETSHKDSPLPVTSYEVASVFEVITQTLLDIASVNPELKKHLKIILKFVHIAEFILQQHIASKKSIAYEQKTTVSLREVFETLYLILIGHKEKHEKLLNAFEKKELSSHMYDLPSKKLQECHFTNMLQGLKQNFKNVEWVQNDVNFIEKLHAQYHKDVAKLYDLEVQQADQAELKAKLNEVDKTSKSLFDSLNKPFQNTASLTFLTIKSGMKFLQQFGELLGEIKMIPYHDQKEFLEFTTQLFKSSVENSLAWALKSFDLSIETLDNLSDIQEQIVLHEYTLYIYIEVNELPYKSFLLDALEMFLEMFKITLVNKEKEYRLALLADKSESANRSKDMFLANMSHELRTPLNAIIGFSQILQMKSEIPDNLKQYIQKISIAGNNLLNIVNTILDFAKLEAGKISFHPKMVFLAKLIDEVSVIISPLAEAKNIRLSFPSEISLGLFIDEQLIKQVLINLLSNAVKFTPNGGEVKLAIEYKGEERCYVLSVCDSGVGMGKEDMAKLFKPFSQVENSLQGASQGTGLGLVIAKKIVEDLHQGKIWVESEVDKGSSFHFSIPISNEQSKVEMFASKKEDALSLIIVEDSQEYVDILVERLKKFYNITVTNSIITAKELVSQQSYNLMILDFFLTDGISSDLLTFMEYNDIAIPIYIISAEDDFKIVEHLQETKHIAGIFNKKDVEIVCEQIVKASHG